MNILIKAIEKIFRFLFYVSALCIFLMMAIVFTNVVLRYAFNMPFYWVEEITAFLLLSSTFLAAAEIFITKRHVKLTIFLDKYPEKVKNVVDAFIGCCGLMFTTLLSREFYISMEMAYNTNMTTPTLLSMPLTIPYSVMMLGFGFLFLAFLIRLGRSLSALFNKTQHQYF